ncbi:MAG: cation diffusion facilitator family transporter [Spirochaetales bacterium]|nr:cation diffusion facilitator family transporter [Spirochaetales bacterium]
MNDHDHAHCHGVHNHAAVGDLRMALLLNALFTAIEFAGGVWTNSVAVLSDAVHDLGDTVTLALALAMERIAGRERTSRLTFGYRRFSTLGAVFTGTILVVGATVVLIHTVPRLIAPQAVHARGMVVLAVLGIVVNGLAVLRLSRTSSMNARAAMLHLGEDLVGWIAVLAGAIVMDVWNVPWLDPLLAIAINLVVVVRAVKVLREALRVFLQFAPDSVDLETAKSAIEGVPGVCGVHDLHLWTLDGEYCLASAHIVTAEAAASIGELEPLKVAIKGALDRVGVHHATLELEAPGADCHNCEL